jgi:hypothetical protein
MPWIAPFEHAALTQAWHGQETSYRQNNGKVYMVLLNSKKENIIKDLY